VGVLVSMISSPEWLFFSFRYFSIIHGNDTSVISGYLCFPLGAPILWVEDDGSFVPQGYLLCNVGLVHRVHIFLPTCVSVCLFFSLLFLHCIVSVPAFLRVVFMYFPFKKYTSAAL